MPGRRIGVCSKSSLGGLRMPVLRNEYWRMYARSRICFSACTRYRAPCARHHDCGRTGGDCLLAVVPRATSVCGVHAAPSAVVSGQTLSVYSVHTTRKLLDRLKAPIGPPVIKPSTALGNWYATAILWRPQVALFVNDKTFLPVVVALAPAESLLTRFPAAVGDTLDAPASTRVSLLPNSRRCAWPLSPRPLIVGCSA